MRVSTRESSAGSLPRQLSSFVGRRPEILEVKRLLSSSRLVTLSGVGGVGKTRLAGQVTADLRRTFPDGVWFLDLAELDDPDPELLAQLVAGALRLPGPPGLDQLLESLAARRLLVVLDSCEHLLPAVARVADAVLRSSTQVRLLVTSREPLLIPGEVTFRVPPLAVPPGLHGYAGWPTGYARPQRF